MTCAARVWHARHMRVAVDLRWMQDTPLGGVGRSLAHTMPLLPAEIELHALTDAARAPLTVGIRQHALRTPWPGVAAGWLQVSAARWLRGFDGIFHCPWYGLPYLLPVPGVATLYDLTFEHHPEWFSAARRLVYRRQARQAARAAVVLLTGSEHVRGDIVATYGVVPEQVLVAPCGVDPAFRAGLPPLADLPERYVVALGGAVRRGLPLAVGAWESAATGLPLLIVGPREPVPVGVTHLGPLDDAHWARVLGNAAAFLWPTADEGFGMPGLEAAASGTPVVCAPVGALPEVLGDVPVWAAGLGVSALAAALRSATLDPAVAGTARAAGPAHCASRPTWADAAAVHAQAYRIAAGTTKS